MSSAAQTSEPQTAADELISYLFDSFLEHDCENDMSPPAPWDGPEVRRRIARVESEAQRLTMERLRQRFDFDPCHECDNAEAAYAALAREEAGE